MIVLDSTNYMKLSDSWKYNEDKMQLRQRCLTILMNRFPNENTTIYNCCDDWIDKQVTTNGIVDYFQAYYGQHGQT